MCRLSQSGVKAAEKAADRHNDALPLPSLLIQAITQQCNSVGLSNDKQCLMTCLNKAASITKGAFCCHEMFCVQKRAESIFLPFVSPCCLSLGALPHSASQENCCAVVCRNLSSVPFSQHLRQSVGQKKKYLPDWFPQNNMSQSD